MPSARSGASGERRRFSDRAASPRESGHRLRQGKTAAVGFPTSGLLFPSNMAMQTSSASKLNSPKTQRWLLWISAAVLAAGVAAVLITFFRNTGSSQPQVFSNEPVQTVEAKPKQVKADPAVKVVAGKFILTAVQRQNLDQAWALVGPGIRQDLTYKEWLTGDIPVVPFLQKIKIAPMKVDISEKDYVLLEVVLLPVTGRGEIFDIELIRLKGKW